MRQAVNVLIAAMITALPVPLRADTLEINHVGMIEENGALNWMSFVCDRRPTQMACTTFQTLINNKISQNKINGEIEKQTAILVAEPNPVSTADCANFQNLRVQISALKPDVNGIIRSNDGKVIRSGSLKYLKESVDALLAVCHNKTPDNLRRLAEIDINKSAKTCRIFNVTGKIEFTRDAQTGKWIANQGPSGPCGIVNVDTLEYDLSVNEGKPNDTFMIYTTRRIVTNPNGQLPFGQSCKSLDEHTFRFDWRTQESTLGCEFIDYGP